MVARGSQESDDNVTAFQQEQPMLRTGAGIEVQQMDMAHLIDITSELPDCHGVLTKVQQLVQRSHGGDQLEPNRIHKKKWKRNKGKENVAPGRTGNLLNGTDQAGKKRQWQLIDEAEDLCSPLASSKRQNECSEVMIEDDVDVGVANLK